MHPQSPATFEVQELFGNEKKKQVVHARRMILYKSDREDKVVDENIIQYAEYFGTTVEIASAIKNIKSGEEGMMVQVEWSAMPDESDWTWEPIGQVREEFPGMLEDFLENGGHRRLKNMARSQIFG